MKKEKQKIKHAINKNRKFNKGFTLLELLVVVLIIGILAAIALPQYKFAVTKSKFNALKANVKAIAEARERDYLIHNQYTNNLDELDIDIPYVLKNCYGECQYSLNQAKTAYLVLNRSQTYVVYSVNESDSIAYVYYHDTKKYLCVPYSSSGLRYKLCQQDK